jgi:predicted dehydrogenase
MQKVAIIGCGKIADGHVEQIRATGRAQIVAVCDRNIEMARQLALRYGIAGIYDDMEKMYASESIDIVHIATPPDSHVFLSKAAFAAGKHVFLEKPFTLTAPETAQILEAARASQRIVSVNHLYRYESPFVQLQQLFKDGQIGEIVHIETNFGYSLEGDFGKALLGDENHWVHKLPGKLFQNVLDHVFCKLVDFVPEQSAQVSAQVFNRRLPTGVKSFDEFPDELRIQLKSGMTTASVFISAHIKPVGHTMMVYGTKNSYALDFNARTIVPVARQSAPSAIGRLLVARQAANQWKKQFWSNAREFKKSDFHFFISMRRLLVDFYAACANGSAEPIDYAYIQATANYIDRTIEAYKSVSPQGQ